MSGTTGDSTHALSEDLLVRRAQRGDDRAVEHLVLRHQPLRAVVTALKLRLDPYRVNDEDLESIARVAIIEALASFDPHRGARFPTYAFYAIRSAMIRYLFPPSERRFDAATPTRNVSIETVGTGQDPASWEGAMADRDPDYGREAGYDAVIDAQRDAAVREFVDELTPNQRTITRAIYWGGETHAQLASVRGISRPAITRTLKRVHARGAKHLRDYTTAIAS